MVDVVTLISLKWEAAELIPSLFTLIDMVRSKATVLIELWALLFTDPCSIDFILCLFFYAA